MDASGSRQGRTGGGHASRPAWPGRIGAASILLAVAVVLARVLLLGLDVDAQFASELFWVAFAAFCSVLLMVGGVLVLQRKPAGRTVLLGWGWIVLLAALGRAVFLLICWGDASPHLKPEYVADLLRLAATDAVPILYAVFLLIWLTRRKTIRALREF